MTTIEYAEVIMKSAAAQARGDIEAWLHWDRMRADEQARRQKEQYVEKYPAVKFERRSTNFQVNDRQR